MRLRKKILVGVLFCLGLQNQGVQGEIDRNVIDTLNKTMEEVHRLIKEHGDSLTEICSLINGHEAYKDKDDKNHGALEIEESLGSKPLIIVERKAGKLLTIASRKGGSEIGKDLTHDTVHQALAKIFESGKETLTIYYTEADRHFEVLAFLPLKGQTGGKQEGREVYCATEQQVSEVPAGVIYVIK